jgi:hypothetical protein
MNTTFRLVCAMVIIACFSLSSYAQRQTKLYIDDGSGHFTVLQGATGGGTITFPSASGQLLSTASAIAVDTEIDTAKAADTVHISATTSEATIVNNGATSTILAHIPAGTSGQLLWVFNNTTETVSLGGATVSTEQIGFFIYIAGAWRMINPSIS